MQSNQLPKSVLSRIRVADSQEEIGQLLHELDGYGFASEVTVRRARRAAKKRMIELEEAK